MSVGVAVSGAVKHGELGVFVVSREQTYMASVNFEHAVANPQVYLTIRGNKGTIAFIPTGMSAGEARIEMRVVNAYSECVLLCGLAYFTFTMPGYGIDQCGLAIAGSSEAKEFSIFSI